MTTIRPACASDSHEVFRLACQLSERFQVERSAFLKNYSILLKEADVRITVAVEDGIVTGYLLGWCRLAFYSNGSVGWVQEIVVDPKFRRSGVGRLLMKDFEDWIAERGGKLVSLATRGASDFYRTQGYQESATYYKKAIKPNKSSLTTPEAPPPSS